MQKGTPERPARLKLLPYPLYLHTETGYNYSLILGISTG
jgi:hypothetical protein